MCSDITLSHDLLLLKLVDTMGIQPITTALQVRFASEEHVCP